MKASDPLQGLGGLLKDIEDSLPPEGSKPKAHTAPKPKASPPPRPTGGSNKADSSNRKFLIYAFAGLAIILELFLGCQTLIAFQMSMPVLILAITFGIAVSLAKVALWGGGFWSLHKGYVENNKFDYFLGSTMLVFAFAASVLSFKTGLGFWELLEARLNKGANVVQAQLDTLQEEREKTLKPINDQIKALQGEKDRILEEKKYLNGRGIVTPQTKEGGLNEQLDKITAEISEAYNQRLSEEARYEGLVTQMAGDVERNKTSTVFSYINVQIPILDIKGIAGLQALIEAFVVLATIAYFHMLATHVLYSQNTPLLWAFPTAFVVLCVFGPAIILNRVIPEDQKIWLTSNTQTNTRGLENLPIAPVVEDPSVGRNPLFDN